MFWKQRSFMEIFVVNKILTVPSLYIYETIIYNWSTNSEINFENHNYNTRNKSTLIKQI